MLITFTDESMAGKILHEISIETQTENLTAREIIELRVRAEVENYNKQAKDRHFNGLVVPKEAEKVLNGYVLKKGHLIDAEKQCYTALDAFQKNGFFILIDDKQADELEQRFTLSQHSKISFVKLTPLVGG
jgi:hypothetical protein